MYQSTINILLYQMTTSDAVYNKYKFVLYSDSHTYWSWSTTTCYYYSSLTKVEK